MGFSPADGLNLFASTKDLAISKSVAYADGPRHSLDVYAPKHADKAPVIAFFYGGNWQSGEKGMYLFLAAALAERGYVVVVPDYRLFPDARLADFMSDAAQAVAWTKRNVAQYGGDANAVFLMGHSAGAYIAAMLAYDARWLGAVTLDPRRDLAGLIGVAGPYDFLPIKDPELITIFGGARRPETQPITFVSGGEAPALLVAPTKDDIVDPANTTRLAKRLRDAGDDVTTHFYSWAGHISIVGAFSPLLSLLAPVTDDADAFIRDVMQKRAAQAARKEARP